MTILPRAATAPELAKLRSDNQSSRVFLTIQVPAQVYVARVASTPASKDNVASIAYNSGSGTYTNILADMTMYVSATGYGNYDKGMVRIRNTTGLGATSGTISVFTSEINWAANDYLTIVDAFDLWPRTPYGANMDYDVAYTDQHSKCASIPCLGGRYKVKWLTGPTVSVYPDGSSSWALNNTITGIQWAAPGSSALSGDTTNTPTITYNAANFDAGYRTSLTLTNSDGVTSVGYGRVFVLADEDDAITQFSINNLQGSYTDGGWSAQVTMYGQGDLTLVRDRALCIIHRRDWYGDTEGSIGYVADDENIEMVGWIAGDTIKWATEDKSGTVTFTIQGPQFWLNRVTMPAVGLKNIASHAPTTWGRFTGLTAKSATWHVLYWRTTAPAMMDILPIDNAWAALQLQSGGAQTVWQQISNILNDFLIAKPCCDSLGRLHMQIEQNCLGASARAAIPTVMTITKADWENSIDFDRREVRDVAAVDLSGDIYDGTTSTPTFSLSPGRVFAARGGSVFVRDRLTLFDQAGANELAGAVFGWQNNPYPNWRFQFPTNQHMLDIAPYQYLSIDIVPADTPRYFTETGLLLIPRTIRRIFQNGYFKTEVDIEAVTPIGLGVTGDAPAIPPIVPITPPPLPPPPPVPVPVPTGNAREVWVALNDNHILWSGDYFSGGQPTWNLITFTPGGISNFAISLDGSTVYVARHAGANQYHLYGCTNPKAVTPTWDHLLGYGDSFPGEGGTTVVQQSFWSLAPGPNNTVTTRVRVSSNRWYNAEYTAETPVYTYTPGGADAYMGGYRSYISADAPTWLRNVGPNTNIGHYSQIGGRASGVWQNLLGGHHYGVQYTGITSGVGYLVDIETETTLVTTATTGSNWFSGGKIGPRGAWRGTEINYVDVSGIHWSSSNGSTFTQLLTWGAGVIEQAMLTGNGSLVWAIGSIAGSNVPTRLSNDHGASWIDMTGNFWSLVSGSKVLLNLQLVY